MTERRSKRLSRWASWLFVLSLTGYPFVGLVATLMNWESTIASVPFRALMLAASLVIILQAASCSRWWRNNRWLLLFWFIYLVRLLWDLLIPGVPGAAEALGVFVAITALPSIAVGLAATRGLSERYTAWRLCIVGGAVCALATAMRAFGWGAAQMLSEEATLGRLAFEAVNSITLGHVAASTLLAVRCLARGHLTPARVAALFVIGLAAGTCLLLSNSRGPLLALAVCSVAFALATGHWRWLILMALVLVPAVTDPESAIWARIATGGEDDSSLERLVLQANAIRQFIDHPIVGGAFTELELLTYPHNLFIETAMALGIVGLATLLILLSRSLRHGWMSLRAANPLIALLFLQYFIAAQFSGSIWGAASLWAAVALLSQVGSTAQRRQASTRWHTGASANPIVTR